MRRATVCAIAMMTVLLISSTAVGQTPPAPATPPAISVTPLLKATTSVVGQPIQFPLVRNQVSVILFEIAPGGRRGRHQHALPSVVYILEGTLTVDIEGHGQQVFSAGQTFIEPINTWHAFFNRGVTPVKFLAVFAGQQGSPLAVLPEVRDPVVGSREARIFQGMTTLIGQPILFPLSHNQVTTILVEFAPGAVNPRHQYPVPTVAYVLQGAMTIDIEGRGQHVITAGQAFVQPTNTWNANANRATTPLKFLVVFLGEEGTPLTVRP